MTDKELQAALQTLQAVADSIRELGTVPSGHIYACLMGKVSLEGYEKMIGILKRAGLVTEDNQNLLTWTEK